MKKSKSKTKKNLMLASKIIFILLVVISVVLFEIVLTLQVMPLKYILPIIIVYSLICFGIGYLIAKRKVKIWIKILMDIICVLLIVTLGVGLYYLNKTMNFMGKIQADDYQTEEYYVIVDKDSSYKSLDDINNKILAIYESPVENYNKALEEVKSKISVDEKKYSNYVEPSNDLLSGNIDSLLISSAYKDIVNDEIENFNDEVRIIYTIEMKVENQVEVKNVNVTDESFNIYISGIDIYGKISLTSRSDVNMIVTVNPKTHKILMTSIPRDYYVQLHGTTGYRDKLTHAGIYGVNKSIETIQDLLDIDINYYIRVNFTTLINLVDAIGGIDVYSDASFQAHTDYRCHYTKGMMHLDGKCALAFARERYAYKEGDRHRVKNQQDVLSAIINKALSSKTLITKYTAILESMGSSFQTNMPEKKIYELVNKQLDSMPSWTIENYSLNGTDKMAYTYSYAGQQLYVMEPDMSTVEEARNKIDEIEKSE